MEPEVRGAIVLVGLLFVFLFGGSALVVIGGDYGTKVDVLAIVSLLIAGMILLGVLAVIRNPPDD
jgi:hypothetical protein